MIVNRSGTKKSLVHIRQKHVGSTRNLTSLNRSASQYESCLHMEYQHLWTLCQWNTVDLVRYTHALPAPQSSNFKDTESIDIFLQLSEIGAY